MTVSSILFPFFHRFKPCISGSITSLTFFSDSSPYSSPYFLATPRAKWRKKNDKERRYEGKARPYRCLFWLFLLEDGVKIWKSVHKASVQNKFGDLFSCKSAINRGGMVAPPNGHHRCNLKRHKSKRAAFSKQAKNKLHARSSKR